MMGAGTAALAALPLGLAVGLSLSLLGAGGSLLTVPMLVYLLGVEPHAAAAASLIIVGAVATTGALARGPRGGLRIRDGLVFSAFGVGGSIAGAIASQQVREELFLALFAVLVAVAAFAMLRNPSVREGHRSWLRVGLTGLGTGLLTGFFGVGGGFVVVPALIFALGMSMKDAIGTSLLVIAINSAAGLAGRLGAGVDLTPAITLPFALGGIVGALAGARMSHKLPERTARLVFASFLFLLSGWLAYENVSALTAS